LFFEERKPGCYAAGSLVERRAVNAGLEDMKPRPKRKRTDPVGHHAPSPWSIPKRGWKQVIKRTWAQTSDDNIALVAAGVAFYGFLAFVPLLAAIVLLYGLAADVGTMVATMRSLFGVLPRDIATLIGDQLAGVVHTSQGKKGVGLAVAVLIALYGASNGAGAVITALNIAYEEKERRPLWKVYLLTFIITVSAVIAALLALAATTALSFLGTLLPHASRGVIVLGRVIAYALLALAAAGAAATLFRYAPSREEARWVWITPGSAFTAISWLILTFAFGFYATRVANFNATYGSLAAVVGLQTWMYLSAYTFVLGAELNAEIEHQTAKDSTTGKPAPLGRRGAWAADHVAGEDKAQEGVAERLSRRKQPPLAGEAQKRRLELFESPHLNLSNPLPAHAIDLAEFLERFRLVGQPPLHQDMLFSVVQALKRRHQQIVTDPTFLILGNHFVLQRATVDQEILPLVFALAVFQRGVEAGVAAHRHAAIHGHDFFLGHAEVSGDLGHVRGLEIAFLERFDLVLHPAKVEEQLLLRGRRAHFHKRPGAQDEFLDRGADPPHRVSREAEPTVGFELLNTLHQADIAFADQLADREAITAVSHCDLRHEPKVRVDQLRRSLSIAVLAPALGEHIFFLRREDRELLDLREIAVESGLPTGRGERDDPFCFSHILRLLPLGDGSQKVGAPT
jgi:membrane protein